MVEVQVTRIFKAPRDKVFRTVTDVENAPKILPKYFKTVMVVKKEGNAIYSEEELKYAGRKVKQTSKHTLYPPERHEVEVVAGDTAGTKVVERYSEVPEGTRVEINADLHLGGFAGLLGGLVKGKIQGTMKDLLDDFAKVIE